jgi:hypothetical protein
MSQPQTTVYSYNHSLVPPPPPPRTTVPEAALAGNNQEEKEKQEKHTTPPIRMDDGQTIQLILLVAPIY